MFKFNDGSQVILGVTKEEAELAQELNSRLNLEAGDTFSMTEITNELQRIRGFRLNASRTFNTLLRSNLIIEV